VDIPPHAYDLIDRLDEVYPEVLYTPGEDAEAFLLKQGERRLVNTLKALRARELMEQHHVQ